MNGMLANHPQPSRRFLGWIRHDTAASLAVGGLVLYVILRLPYSIYYAKLGTTPEEVGLSYADLLGKSTLGVLLALALGLLLWFAISYLITWTRLLKDVRRFAVQPDTWCATNTSVDERTAP
jgi:hypothetical protein